MCLEGLELSLSERFFERNEDLVTLQVVEWPQHINYKGRSDQVWSPKLETISEHKNNTTRFSPCRFIGLEWKQKEKSIC